MNKSSRIYSFDVLRAISTIAIIVIHVSDGVFLEQVILAFNGGMEL